MAELKSIENPEADSGEEKSMVISRAMVLAGESAYELYCPSVSPDFLVKEIYKAMHSAYHHGQS